jgi:hypothetical protein
MTETWTGINTKTAAALAGVNEKRFRQDWVPEDGPAQVDFRDNGKTGRARRIEVNLVDLERVLALRTHKRAS